MNYNRFILPILLGLNFLIKFWGAIRPLKFIDGHAIPDDAYLCLTIARNIAGGLGPLYGFDYTNGFQPLYVFIMAPVFRLFPHSYLAPVHAAMIIAVVFDTATLFLIYRLVARLSKSYMTPILISVAWMLSFSIIRTTLNGMETAVSMFFIALAYYYFFEYRLGQADDDDSWQALIFGVILGLALLARIDNVFLAALFLLTVFIIGMRRAGGFSRAAKTALAIILGMGLTCLPWVIYQYRYIGDIIPGSGTAVRHLTLAAFNDKPTLVNLYIPMVRMGLAAIIKDNIHLIILLLALSVGLAAFGRHGALRTLRQNARRHNIILAFSISLFLVYVFYIFGCWYFRRYFYPFTFLMLLYLASTIDVIHAVLPNKRQAMAFNAGIALFFMVSLLISPTAKIMYWDKETEPIGHMSLGLWAKANFPDSTVVGGCQTGALGYFADNLRVVNLDGVVNRKCYEALSQQRALDYIGDAEIDYFIDWRDFHDFIIKHSERGEINDMQLLRTIDDFKTWHNEWRVYQF